LFAVDLAQNEQFKDDKKKTRGAGAKASARAFLKNYINLNQANSRCGSSPERFCA